VGRPLVFKYAPDRAREWSDKVARHRDNLLSYMLFLRITPFLPNWFINLASPIIGVPLSPFFWGTFFGESAPRRDRHLIHFSFSSYYYSCQ
jgi:uncharacterized membrane protein YdjX (TVP38/TMEM64 family)